MSDFGYSWLRYCLVILIILMGTGCTAPADDHLNYAGHSSSERLPADCRAVVDTFITKEEMRKRPDDGIRAFNKLAAKYQGRDTLTYATMRAYSAQGWDAKGEGDSIIAACEDGLAYFDDQLMYLDLRTMCHLYMGWGYYYKNNQLTANYFFSLAGNDMTDTVFVPGTGEYIVSKYPPATKAALLEEIAAMARISGLYEQARRYISLSRQHIDRLSHPDHFLKCTIYLEAASTYSHLKYFDTAAYLLKQVASEVAHLQDLSLQQMYLDHKADYFFDSRQYDSCISTSLVYQARAALDTIATKKDHAAAQKLVLAHAYAAKGEYIKAKRVLSSVAAVMEDEENIIADLHIHYLEIKAAVLLTEHLGPEGYNLIEQYSDSKNKLYDQQRLAAITDMDARYKTRRKEDAIRRLNIDNDAYARRVRRQSKILLIVVLSFLLVVAIGVIIYQRQGRRRLQESVDRMELEQRLLRSQMEPHFIFNTLAVLQGLIRREERDVSIKYLNQFARLLRISLEHAREGFVPLRGEVDALGHYLALQQVRFQNAFTYTIDTWEDYEEEGQDLLIPPMLLQPFAENAVQHGMKGFSNNEGHIHISLQRDKYSIRVAIEDNGEGFDADAPPAKGEKQSLATVITRERLAILGKKTGQPASIFITSKIGKGTRVLIIIPYTMKGLSKRI